MSDTIDLKIELEREGELKKTHKKSGLMICVPRVRTPLIIAKRRNK